MSDYTDGPNPRYKPTRDFIGEIVSDTRIICCGCGSVEHNLIYRPDRDEKEVWLYYSLNKEVWYKRIWLGIKYIFGFQSKYGMYGEMLVNEANVGEFEKIVKHIKE